MTSDKVLETALSAGFLAGVAWGLDKDAPHPDDVEAVAEDFAKQLVAMALAMAAGGVTEGPVF